MADFTDYKELYFKLFRATSQAVELLIAAQQECEELYCASADSELQLLDFTKKNQPDT